MKQNTLCNTIYNMDCFEFFDQCQDKCFDVVFTSPPYEEMGETLFPTREQAEKALEGKGE